jgi:uncharacterized membrane protein YeaQ/YmgE (transglycosylase-associated protein family)
MNLLLKLVVGAIAGWLTGKAVDGEGFARTVSNRHVFDVLLGLIGGALGGRLFFWIVIGEPTLFTDISVAVLGAITVTGALRMLTSGLRV